MRMLCQAKMADSAWKLVTLFLCVSELERATSLEFCLPPREGLELLKAACAQCLLTCGEYPMLWSLKKIWVAISQAETFSPAHRPNPNNLPEVPCKFAELWRPITALRSQPFTANLNIVLPMVICLMDEFQVFYSTSAVISIRTPADGSDREVLSALMDAKLIFEAIAAVINIEDGSECNSAVEWSAKCSWEFCCKVSFIVRDHTVKKWADCWNQFCQPICLFDFILCLSLQLVSRYQIQLYHLAFGWQVTNLPNDSVRFEAGQVVRCQFAGSDTVTAIVFFSASCCAIHHLKGSFHISLFWSDSSRLQYDRQR